jgi:hypothetical protein
MDLRFAGFDNPRTFFKNGLLFQPSPPADLVAIPFQTLNSRNWPPSAACSPATLKAIADKMA